MLRLPSPLRFVSRRVWAALALPCVLLLLGGLGSGCALSPSGLGISPEDAQQEADRSLNYAVLSLDGQAENGDRRSADTAIRAAVQMLGGSGEAYAIVGRELIERGHPAEAVRLLSEAAQNKKNASEILLTATLADAYKKAGDTASEARVSAQAAQQAEAIMATVGKTSKTASETQMAEAVSQYVSVSQYYTDDDKNIPRAFTALREAYRLAPDSPLVLNALGYTLADKGTSRDEFKEAVQLTRAAVDKAPGVAAILDSYGWALFKTGDFPGARRVLREAADDGANMAETHYHLGVVYGQMGQIDDARLEFNRALVIRKNYPDAETAKKQLKQPPGKGVSEGA